MMTFALLESRLHGVPALSKAGTFHHNGYMLGAAVPSDHLPTGIISTLTGSGAP